MSSQRSYGDYRQAAVTLWGEAGAYAHDAYTRHLRLYPGLPEQLPIVIGITAYGHCLGATRGSWQHGPRISLFSNQFHRRRQVDDVMVHEMLHAWLVLRGENPDHDGGPWYAAVPCPTLPDGPCQPKPTPVASARPIPSRRPFRNSGTSSTLVPWPELV